MARILAWEATDWWRSYFEALAVHNGDDLDLAAARHRSWAIAQGLERPGALETPGRASDGALVSGSDNGQDARLDATSALETDG